MKIFHTSGRHRKSKVLTVYGYVKTIFLSGLPDLLPAKPAHIHKPELSDKIAKSAYIPINLSLIGIKPDACPQSSSLSISTICF